jgi:hypothetical protein
MTLGVFPFRFASEYCVFFDLDPCAFHCLESFMGRLGSSEFFRSENMSDIWPATSFKVEFLTQHERLPVSGFPTIEQNSQPAILKRQDVSWEYVNFRKRVIHKHVAQYGRRVSVGEAYWFFSV